MKNEINEVKNEPILNNEYTNDTNDRSPQRELSTPLPSKLETDDIQSQKITDIVVEPFRGESKKQTSPENQKSERTKLFQKKKNV